MLDTLDSDDKRIILLWHLGLKVQVCPDWAIGREGVSSGRMTEKTQSHLSNLR
jgi:hypothetical protein